MSTDQPSDFDFDHWAALARENPALFERARLEHIESLIARTPLEQQHRLRGLQWTIDQTRQRAGDPARACAELSDMMWNRVAGNAGLLSALTAFGAAPAETSDESAQVVTMESRQTRLDP